MVKNDDISISILLLILFITYISFSVLRPIEEDESLYIRSGAAIIKGDLDPFKVTFYEHYANPFLQIFGSPLAPIIYGAVYITGTLLSVRLVAACVILMSLYIIGRLIIKTNGRPLLPLIIIGFSSSTIMLASDAILDSIAILFFVSSLYCLYSQKMFIAGILSGLAMTTKFILVIPLLFIFLHILRKKSSVYYLLGSSLIILPFISLYWNIIPFLLRIVWLKKAEGSIMNLMTLTKILLQSLPIASLYALFCIRPKKKTFIFTIPVISIILFQLLFSDFNSLKRHLPYAEFSAAVLLSRFDNKKILSILAALFIFLSLGQAYKDVRHYPSYDKIEHAVSRIEGKVLALNPNSYILINDMPIDATAENVFSYYYFNYDDVYDSKIEEYEQALKDGYFDYAVISTTSPKSFPRYLKIEDLVRKYYCPILENGASSGMDIYARCEKNITIS